MTERKRVTELTALRYRRGRKKEKGVILDEFTRSALRSLSSVALSSVEVSKTLSQKLSKRLEKDNFITTLSSSFCFEATNQPSSAFFGEATGSLSK